jgi:hypothetical protein
VPTDNTEEYVDVVCSEPLRGTDIRLTTGEDAWISVAYVEAYGWDEANVV